MMNFDFFHEHSLHHFSDFAKVRDIEHVSPPIIHLLVGAFHIHIQCKTARKIEMPQGKIKRHVCIRRNVRRNHNLHQGTSKLSASVTSSFIDSNRRAELQTVASCKDVCQGLGGLSQHPWILS